MIQQAPAIIVKFFSTYPVVMYQKGAILAQSGQKMDSVYLILEGKIRQFDITRNGSEVTLNTYRSPSILSLSWVFDSAENRYGLQASATTRLAVAPLEAFRQLLMTDPVVALSILERLSIGLEGFLTRLSAHMGGKSDRRVAIEIVLHVHRFGRIAADKSCIVNDLSVNELAASCGIARETASRQLKVLHQKGLLEKQQSHIAIPNFEALEEFAMA